MTRRLSRLVFPGAIGVLAATLALALLLPLLALLVRTGPAQLATGLASPAARAALRLSVVTTAVSLACVLLLGTPLAWLLTRSRSRLARAVETLAQLPIVIPPAVAGVALLLAWGRNGLLAGVLFPAGWSLALTGGAVVMAQVFVSAPLYVQAATAAFRRVDEELLVVARTLGAGPARVFLRVALPLAAPGLAGGAGLSFSRALGEFGATLMFAGNLERVTQTLPLAIYSALESDPRVAQALSVLLLACAFGLLLAARLAQRER